MWDVTKLLRWSACQGGAGQGASYCGYAEIGTLAHPTLARGVGLPSAAEATVPLQLVWGVSASDFCVPAI